MGVCMWLVESIEVCCCWVVTLVSQVKWPEDDEVDELLNGVSRLINNSMSKEVNKNAKAVKSQKSKVYSSYK
jgi:hypothetical protein